MRARSPCWPAVAPGPYSTQGVAPIAVNAFSLVVSGSYEVDGATVRFTPEQPLPGDVQVRVRVNSNSVLDVSGNGGRIR